MGHTRPGCVFCDIVSQSAQVSVVCEDARAMAFMDLRQFHSGHVLVIPKAHVPDVRGLFVRIWRMRRNVAPDALSRAPQ